MNREIIAGTADDEVFQPFAHHFAFPTDHGAFVNRKAFIRYDQILVDSQHFPEAFTHRTSTQRVVEAEHHVGRFDKGHAVCLEFLGKLFQDDLVLQIDTDPTNAMSFEEGGLCRISQSAS